MKRIAAITAVVVTTLASWASITAATPPATPPSVALAESPGDVAVVPLRASRRVGARTEEGYSVSTGRAGTFAAFLPTRADDGYMVTSGSLDVVVRPAGAAPVPAEAGPGKIAYRQMYASTDSIHHLGALGIEEFLLLHDENAPKVFDYGLELPKACDVALLETGGLRFTLGDDVLMIAPPYAVDSRGRRSQEALHYTLDRYAPDAARLSLVLDATGLTFPLAVDPAWTTVAPMALIRAGHSATTLPSGRVLVAGGAAGIPTTAQCEIYDPALGWWYLTGSLATAREGHTATSLNDGRVLVTGGFGGTAASSTFLKSAEVYNPSAGTWASAGSMSVRRTHHTATLLANGRVLVVGGWSLDAAGNTISLSTCEIYNPATNAWTLAAPLPAPRQDHTATRLADGRVLVVGGYDDNVSPIEARAEAYLYDPATNAWTPTGSLGTARRYHKAVRLDDGRILVAGGTNDDGPQSYDPVSAEVYRPTGVGAGTWASAGSMSYGRTGFEMGKLANGRVLVTGGDDFTDVSCDVFNPTTNTWSPTDALNRGRYAHAMTKLADGRMLVCGGIGNNGAFLNSVEIR